MARLLLLAFVPGVAAVYRNQSQTHGCNIGRFYEFDWADVYSLERKMPQGCTCAAGGVSKSNCKVFDCGCTCDLTAGGCDYNCCCDPDCTDAEVSRFEASEAGCILHEEEPDFQKCYNVEGINERYPMAYTGTARGSIDQLLCVAIDNSDVKGNYYEDPGIYEDDSTVFDDDRGQKIYAYTDVIPGGSSDRGSSTVCALFTLPFHKLAPFFRSVSKHLPHARFLVACCFTGVLPWGSNAGGDRGRGA